MPKTFLFGIVFLFLIFGCILQANKTGDGLAKISGPLLQDTDCDSKGIEEKGFCLGEIALRNKSPLDCNSNDIGVTSDCLAFFAFGTKNTDVCFNQNLEFDQGMCLGYYAEKAGNYDICGKFDANDFRSLIRVNCYYYLADKVKDVNVCNNLKSSFPDYDYWARCVMEVATSRNEWALCDIIDDTWVKDLCYIGISQDTGDPTLCKKISDPEFKQSCEESFLNKPN